MRKKRFSIALALGIGAAVGLAGCTAAEPDLLPNGDQKHVNLAVFNGWDEGVAASELWKNVLTERGYDVSLHYADVAPVFAGLAAGDYDFVLDSWLPVMHADYLKKYGDRVEDLGAWFEEGTLRLAVNADAPIDSLDELAQNADLFNSTITGIESGANYMSVVEKEVMPAYGLDKMRLATSSTPAMLAELGAGLRQGENVLVTLWHPHWAYDAFDLKDLEDPLGALGETEGVHSIGSRDFKTRFPTLHRWIGEFRMEGDTLNSLENAMFNDRSGEISDLARQWIEENPEFMASLPGAVED